MMSDLDKGGLADIRRVVESYTIRAVSPPEPPTLMEIARFPHRENVYSNVLAFLFDTEQAHGFGPLFIRSLIAAYRCNCRDDACLPGAPCPETIEATDSVGREVRTARDNRIDLLVDCADFLVCIENKIRADLYNDLRDYRSYCEEPSVSDGRPVLGIVLSPDGVASPDLKSCGFVSITYGDLVEQVRRRMGSHIGSDNTQYQYLLFDFLEQASRFSRTTNMNDDEQAFLDFWKKNDPKISNIQEWIGRMWELLDANGKAKAHQEQCRAKLCENEWNVFKGDWIYQKTVAVFDLAEGRTIDGCRIFLDVQFHPLRVTHVLGNRQRDEPTKLVREVNAHCGTDFKKSTDRFEFVIKESPFDDSVRKKAVKTSVRILKYIAARRLADTSDR